MAVVIPYADYAALQEALDDLRDGRIAAARLAAWRGDASLGRPLAAIEAEWRAQGLL